LSFWKDGQRLHTYPLTARQFPHRVITERQEGLPAVDFTVLSYHSPIPDNSESMKALLRGWAFTATGPLTHVSLVNAEGQFLKLQAFKLDRDDIKPMFKDRTGEEALQPLGFHIETPVLDESPITVQFWKDNLRVHEIPLEELPQGHWGTVESTASGIPLTIGIGKRQIPELTDVPVSLRREIRRHISSHFNLYLLALVLIPSITSVLLRAFSSRERICEKSTVATVIVYIALFLLGRAVFYGLVEAAVVPGVNRYMDCASPIASVLLVLLVFLPVLMAYEIYLLLMAKPTGLSKEKET
jgi:hypothetical protein